MFVIDVNREKHATFVVLFIALEFKNQGFIFKSTEHQKLR